MKPSFIGLCLLIKQIKHTKETSWNGPLAYQWIKNIVYEQNRKVMSWIEYMGEYHRYGRAMAYGILVPQPGMEPAPL